MKYCIILGFLFFCNHSCFSQQEKEYTDTTFYSSGKIKSITIATGGHHYKIIHYDDGTKTYVLERDGEHLENITNFRNEKITSVFHYYDHKLHGDAFGYSDSGKINFKGFYENGLKTGKWTFYYENGKPEGEMNVFDADGNLVIKANFIHGKADGFTFFYGANNHVLRKGLYKNGKFVKEINVTTSVQ